MTTLKVQKRDTEKKAKALRREGFVTGTLFGKNIKETVLLQIEKKEAERIHRECFKGSQLNLELDGKKYDVDYVLNSDGVPKCECGGTVRPDVVLYEEGLDMYVMEKAVKYIENADILIIGGTSLVVYPAAGLIQYYRGNKLVLVNLSETSQDRNADLVIHEKIGQVFSQL